MEPKRKQILLRQRAHFEQKLKDRLSFLSGKEIKPPQTERDTIVRKFGASIRAVDRRLKTIAGQERRTEELAKIKADRAAALEASLKKDQDRGKGEKPVKAPEESKAKKAKEEKKAAPPKAPKGAQSRKPKESPEKSKAAETKATVKKVTVKKAAEKKTAVKKAVKKTEKKSATPAKADQAS